MKYQGPVVLQSSHLVEGSCNAGRGRGRRLLDVVERADHVYDRSERVVRPVFGGSETPRDRCRSLLAGVARRKSGLSTSRVEVRTNRQKPASTRSTRAEVPGHRGRCAGGIPEEYLQLAWWRARGVRPLRAGLGV